MGFSRAELASPRRAPGARADLAVIIPVLNEAEVIEACLESVLAQIPSPTEIVVVDGGSIDGTASIAQGMGATVIHTEPGRGIQLHTGATAARSRNLLFLHADSRLPEGALAEVMRALDRGPVVGGKFRLRYDHPRPVLRMLGFLSRFPWTWTSFGDAAFFVRKNVYARIGGFEEVALFEDVRFYRRLSKAGRIHVSHRPVNTSCRRFCRRGPLRQLAANVALYLAHRLGVPDRYLEDWYRPSRRHHAHS